MILDLHWNTSSNLHFILPCSYFLTEFCQCSVWIGEKSFKKYEMSLVTSIKFRTVDQGWKSINMTRNSTSISITLPRHFLKSRPILVNASVTSLYRYFPVKPDLQWMNFTKSLQISPSSLTYLRQNDNCSLFDASDA